MSGCEAVASDSVAKDSKSKGLVDEARPWSHRLLLRVYPRWFRDEFGAELTRYLARQREEVRYRERVVGTVRFWWHAGTDAVTTGLTLRLSQARERGSSF